jgi:hypothetical protein
VTLIGERSCSAAVLCLAREKRGGVGHGAIGLFARPARCEHGHSLAALGRGRPLSIILTRARLRTRSADDGCGPEQQALLQMIGTLVEPAPDELLTGEGNPGLAVTGGSGHA